MSWKKFFPKMVINLPETDIPVKGAHARLFQGKNQQIVFMSFEKDAEVPGHSHKAQWGVVLDGEIELTIGGKRRIFTKGESYFIPENVEHSARIRKNYKDLTLFDQKDRYKAKQSRKNSRN